MKTQAPALTSAALRPGGAGAREGAGTTEGVGNIGGGAF